MEDKNIEKEIYNTRKRAFSKKFNMKKDAMNREELEELIISLNIDPIDKKDLDLIYKSLDVNNDGVVSVDEILTAIAERNINHEKINDVLNKVHDNLLTNSEIMLLKIKNLKKRATFANDKESLDDLNWILNRITEGDIYDPSLENVMSNAQDHNEKDLILEYSHLKKNMNIENDIKQIFINKGSSKTLNRNKSLVNIQNINSLIQDTDQNKSKSIEVINANIENLSKLLQNMSSFDFNMFELDNLTNGNCLYYFTLNLFNSQNFFQFIDETIFKDFILVIKKGYSREIPYHNDIHAADVLQTCFAIVENGKLATKINLTDIDLLSVFLSAICHDFKHPGYNNTYQINFRTDVAINYNDQSVLENYHVSESFKVILDPKYNILANFSNEEFRQIRRRMISCILATDMAYHYKHLSTLKGKLESCEITNGNNIEKLIALDSSCKNNENQQMILDNCIHICDISNPAKKDLVYDKWVDLVFLEFFNQGDKEKATNIPVSLLCDRETTNIMKAQIGFINYIVKPYFLCFFNLIPEIEPYIQNIEANLKRYELKDQESKK